MPLDRIVMETSGSLRRIRRNLWSFCHLVLILAVGLGCVIGIFDVAYGVLHTPLPCPYPNRVAVSDNSYTAALFFSYHQPNPRLTTIFQNAAEYQLLDANLDAGKYPKRIRLAMVSPTFFSTLDIGMAIGNDFLRSDFHPVPGSQPGWLPIILSNEIWRNQFASSKGVLTNEIELSVPPYRFQVVGVAPANMGFPGGVDAWVPVHLTSFSLIQTAGIPASSGGAIGLLKRGVSIVAAEAAIRTWPKQRYFDSGQDGAVKLVSLPDFQAGEIYPLGVRLWFASIVFLVLIIITAGTIFKADAEIRMEEFAIRAALGASPGRLLRELCLESAIGISLALVGSFFVRYLLVHLTAAYLSLPNTFALRMSWNELAMAAGSAGAAFISSLVIHQANLFRMQASFSVVRLLRKQGIKTQQATKSAFAHRIPVQIIPASIILIVAGLLLRSAYDAMHINPGVQTGDAYICEVSLSQDLEKFAAARMRSSFSQAQRDKSMSSSVQLFHEQMNSYITEALSNLAKNPRIIDAGVISTAPYKGHLPLATDVHVSAEAEKPPDSIVLHNVIFRSMTPGAIPALGLRLLYGRNFGGGSAEDANTIIVNEALSVKVGPGSSPLGRYIMLTTLPPARIIGIVSNTREQTLYSQVWPTIYYPFSQYGLSDVDLVVRSAHGVSSRQARAMVETSIRANFPDAVVSHFAPLDVMVESAATMTRYTAGYLVVLATLSVFLAGFCASSKTLGEFRHRKREIGIRIALGATSADIIRSFVYSDLARSSIPAFLGALLAWGFSHVLGQVMYGIRASDPVSYVGAMATLLGTTTIAEMVLLGRALQRNPRELL